MAQDGFARLLEFLDLLEARGHHFRIERQSPDALMVTFTHANGCVEIDFAVDEVRFSSFAGGELAGDIESHIRQIIAERWHD